MKVLFSKSVIFPVFIFLGLFFRVIFQKCYFPAPLYLMILKTNFLIQIIFKKRLGFGSGLDSRVGLVSEVVLGLGLGLALELDLGSGF